PNPMRLTRIVRKMMSSGRVTTVANILQSRASHERHLRRCARRGGRAGRGAGDAASRRVRGARHGRAGGAHSDQLYEPAGAHRSQRARGRAILSAWSAGAEATKVRDRRFAVTPPPPAATPQTFTLVPGADGAIGFLHMGSRALKRIPTKAS